MIFVNFRYSKINMNTIKPGQLVKADIYSQHIGMVISYDGEDRVYVLCGEYIFSWDISYCEPVS